MKTRLLIIAGIWVSLLGMFSADDVSGSDSLDSKSFYDLYYENELVVKGTVVSFEDDPLDGKLQGYNIKITEQFSKPQQTFGLITAFTAHGQNPFDVDDTVLLYLNKLDAKYVISPYSFKVHPNCKDLSFTGLSYLPWQDRPRSSPTGTFPKIFDAQGNRPDSLEVGSAYNIKTDKFRYEPTDQLDLEITVQNLDDGGIVLKERKTHHGDPCNWKNTQWSVTPDKPGDYFMMIVKHKQLFADHIVRPTLVQTAEFTVGTEDSLFSATSSGTNPSLTNQLQLGVPAEHIVCPNEKILVFKNSNNSPACVKPETKTKLTERGWVKNECARLFDANMDAFSKIAGKQDDLSLQMHYGARQNDLVFSSEFFKEWRDYGCVETVNDWANMSEYENFISQVVNWDEQK